MPRAVPASPSATYRGVVLWTGRFDSVDRQRAAGRQRRAAPEHEDVAALGGDVGAPT